MEAVEQQANLDQLDKREASALNRQNVIYERDTEADYNRWAEALRATVKLFYKAKSTGEIVTGKDIAKQMPAEPQPTLLKSRIRQTTILPDGSYTNVVEEVANVGEVRSVQEAQSAIEHIISYIRPVRMETHQTSATVTERDIKIVETPKPVILKS